MQHEIIICTKLNTSISLPSLISLLIELLFHTVEHYGLIDLFFLLHLIDYRAYLRLYNAEAIVEPRVYEMN